MSVVAHLQLQIRQYLALPRNKINVINISQNFIFNRYMIAATNEYMQKSRFHMY